LSETEREREKERERERERETERETRLRLLRLGVVQSWNTCTACMKPRFQSPVLVVGASEMEYPNGRLS
jgi:hypothetical protein